MPKSWFTVRASAGNGAIAIYSDIGEWGLPASDFQSSLNALGKVRELNINISSNGGDIPSGFAIYNMLSPRREKDRHHRRNCSVNGVGYRDGGRRDCHAIEFDDDDS